MKWFKDFAEDVMLNTFAIVALLVVLVAGVAISVGAVILFSHLGIYFTIPVCILLAAIVVTALERL